MPIFDVDSGDLGLVTENLFGLRVVMVNLYGVRTGNTWTLIDAGLPRSANRIKKWAEAHFHTPPKAIVLTHGHFDHVGALRELANEWDVPIYAHALEFPYLTGRSKYPPSDPTLGGGVMPMLSPLFPRGPIDVSERLRALPDDGSIPTLPGWRWIHTPGHTAGHVSLYRDEDRVLIAGDAFINTRQESFLAVLAQRREVNGPPSYFTSDWDAARQSVERLAGLQPNVCATGHGFPIIGLEAWKELDRLADNFDTWSRPVRGRYVPQPALTDERGVVSLPPTAVSPLPMLVIGTILAGGLFYVLSRRRTATA